VPVFGRNHRTEGSGIREIGLPVPGLLVFRVHDKRASVAPGGGVESESTHLPTAAPDRRDNRAQCRAALLSQLPVVFGEHAVHLGDLFMDIKAFCNISLLHTLSTTARFSWVSPFRISDSVRGGGFSKNARLLHRSSSLGTLRHRAALIERRLRVCVQIKFWPLVF